MNVRPDWHVLARNTSGSYVMCNCGHVLQTVESLREHWQGGHFDTWADDQINWKERAERAEAVLDKLLADYGEEVVR